MQKDRDKHGGGLIELLAVVSFVKQYQSTLLIILNVLALNLLFQRKNICFSIYRPPVSSNLTILFEELNNFSSKAILKHENIILMGYFNRVQKQRDIFSPIK